MKEEIDFDAMQSTKWTIAPFWRFIEQSLFIRCLIGLCIILSFTIFFYMHHTRLIIPAVNSIAQKEIISPITFSFLSESESNLRRQKALQDIGKIYKVTLQNIEDQRFKFEKSLSKRHEWRQYLKSNRFEEISHILDKFEQTLLESRYTDVHNLQLRKDLGFDCSHYLLFTPETLAEAIILPEQIWSTLLSIAFTQAEHPPELDFFIINAFREYAWQFEDDSLAESELRIALQTKPFEVHQQIVAGSLIIQKGMQVNPQHIVILKALKAHLLERSDSWAPSSLIASLLISCLFVFLVAAYLSSFHKKIFSSNKLLLLIGIIIAMTLSIAKAMEYFWLRNPDYLENFLHYPIIAPFAAILIAILVNLQIGLLISALLSIALSVGLAFNQEEFLLLNIFSSTIVILSMRQLHWRRDVLIVNMKGWLSSIFLILSLHLYNATTLQTLFPSMLGSLVCFVVNTIIIVGLLPIFESSFRIVTDMSLMEFMDPLSPLLRRLSTEAPGTYQHTLAVANLAESAALSINANGLFCRVATMYHDIGKLSNPSYFIENQQPGMNIHQLLTPLESANVILRHVNDGVLLASKEHLPQPFIEIIQEHHGTSSTYYFYCQQCQLVGKDAVNESAFCYNGPRPSTKESAIIMLADCIEAASRCLDEFNETTVCDLVSKIMLNKTQTGQFDNCPLTFAEIGKIKENIIQNLLASGHMRIKYPSPVITLTTTIKDKNDVSKQA